MSELTKKLHILKDGEAEEETVTLYSTADECAEPNLKFEIDGALAYAKLGDVTDANATSLRIYRNNDGTAYSSEEMTMTAAIIHQGAITVIGYDISGGGGLNPSEITLNGVTYSILRLKTTTTQTTTTYDSYSEIVFEEEIPSYIVKLKINDTEIQAYKTEGGVSDEFTYRFVTPYTFQQGATYTVCCGYSTGATYAVLKGATAPVDYWTDTDGAEHIVDAGEVETISEKQFPQNESIVSISFPSCKTIEGTTFDKNSGAFKFCTNLVEIYLPNVTNIGKFAFWGCSALTEIKLPQVSTLEYGAFMGCTALTTAKLPKVTNGLGQCVFRDCTSLVHVELPNATSIPYCAFQSCSSLETIELPKATDVGSIPFRHCDALKEIHFAAANEDAIKACGDYSSKFGATNATIYFDL